MGEPSTTLVQLFHDCVSRNGSRAALLLPSADATNFTPLSWNELAHEVRRLAAGLCRAGVQPGDRVAQVSGNRYEWILLDLAVHLARGVHVAVHASLSGQQIAHQIADCGGRLVVLSTEQQTAKLAAVADALPQGLQFYAYDAVETSIVGQQVQPFSELLAAVGKQTIAQLQTEALERTRPTDLATILYTSGTTGEAKGVMLTHSNLTSNALGCCAAFETNVDDVRLAWLPFSHIFARTCDLYTWLARGSQLAIIENREHIIPACNKVHPTLMNGVPYFFEKVKQRLEQAGRIGLAEPSGKTYLQLLLGGSTRACCCGGAALPRHVAEFFFREGMPLLEGYGLTESSPVITTSTPQHYKIGCVGRPIDGVEVRIAGDGEILTRGPHVMLGYWNRPADTAETIREGWLHTGDSGELDSEGYLRITGRKKELIVTAGGKNIAPVFLEGLLTEEPLIAQAIVIGEGQKYLTALIVPDPDALRSEIMGRHIPVRSAEEALAHPAVNELYRQRIDQCLSSVSSCEQIQKFKLLARGFTIEHEELTPTLKLRRKLIQDHFAKEIESLYKD